MAMTMLDLKSALIVVDLQKGISRMPAAHSMAEVVERSAALASGFREQGLPVVLVNVDRGAPGRTEAAPRVQEFPPDFVELLPELNQQPGDLVVTKRTWGAFTQTGLEAKLKALGVTQVVVCGVATTAGVESTARQAHEAGLHVTLAVDAMTDMSAEAHENSVTRIFPRLGETGTTAEILALLRGRRTSVEQ